MDGDAGAGVLDYNCSNRTYNGHKGTDIALWPFGWQKMNENSVEVIAGAAGTILLKDNGASDQSCAFCPGACAWNGIYIMHADGTVAWYGHFKNNSITSKLVGATVAAGEYLGIVGSSGNSTGPHLHFELYKNTTYTTANLIDPWAGTCNAYGSPNSATSWWTSQQNYLVPTLNKIMTGSAVPTVTGCSNAEVSYEKTNFVKGDPIVFTTYYRDVSVGLPVTNRIYRPNGTLWNSFSTTFSAGTQFWTGMQYTLPTDANAIGTWHFEVVFNGNPAVNTYFNVSNTLPLNITAFNATKFGNHVEVILNTSNEVNIKTINILQSPNGRNYTPIASFAGKNQPLNNLYKFTHTAPGNLNYYKAEMINNDGSKTYSTVKTISFTKDNRLTVLGNPFKNTITVNARLDEGDILQLINASGIAVYTKTINVATQNHAIATAILPAGIYHLVLKGTNGIVERKTLIK